MLVQREIDSHSVPHVSPRSAAAPFTNLPKLLVLPLIAIVRPGRAGQMLPPAGWAVMIPLILLAGLLIGAGSGLGILAFVEIDARWDYSGEPRPALPFQVIWALEQVLQPGRRMLYLQFAAALAVGYIVMLVAAALVALPRCGRHDPLSVTILRGLMCSYVAAGVIAFGEAVITLLALLIPEPFLFFWEMGPLFMAGGLISLVYLCWLARVADGACPKAEPRGTPTCEGCGYDLTARTLGDRCPECGRSVAGAMQAQNGRADTPWIRRRDFGATFRGALLHPSAFYRQMRLRRRLGPARRFAGEVALTLFIGAVLALTVLILVLLAILGEGPSYIELGFVVLLTACWTVAACQWAHGLVAGAAVLLLRFSCPVPDDRWIGHAACYEWVFAWPLAAFWGVTALLLIFLNQPFTRWFGYVLGVPADAWWLVGGTALLGACWLYRYVLIARAIRWSNF